MTYSNKMLYRYRFHVFGVILGIAVLSRFAGLGAKPIWMDEGYSVWFSNLDWHYLWFEVPRFENHPPLYFMILKAWRSVAGSDEFAIRVPSAVASLGVVVLLFASGRIIGQSVGTDSDRAVNDSVRGWALGLMAAALGTLSQFQILLAGDARPYALSALGGSLMMVGTLQIVCGRSRSEPDGLHSFLAGVALVVGMSLTLWSHSLGIVSAGLTGLFLVGWWLFVRKGDRQVFFRLATMAALVVVLCWPHLMNIIDQMSRDYTGFWIEEPSLKELADKTVHVAGFPGMPGRDRVMVAVAGLLILMGLAGLCSMGNRENRRGATAASYLVALSAGYWLIVVAYTYLVQPVILHRTLVFMQIPILVIMAAAPWALPRGRLVLATGIIGLAAVSAVGPRELQTFPRPWKRIAQTIGEDPTSPVLALPGTVQIMLNYYEDQLNVDLDVRTVPTPWPHIVDGRPDMINDPEVTVETVERIVKDLGDSPVVWFVARGMQDAQSLVREVLRNSGRKETIMTGSRGLWQIDSDALVIRYQTEPTARLEEAGWIGLEYIRTRLIWAAHGFRAKHRNVTLISKTNREQYNLLMCSYRTRGSV